MRAPRPNHKPAVARPNAIRADSQRAAHTHERSRHRRDRTTKKTAGDCEPYYFDWLKCIDKCAMPHIMQKLK